MPIRLNFHNHNGNYQTCSMSVQSQNVLIVYCHGIVRLLLLLIVLVHSADPNISNLSRFLWPVASTVPGAWALFPTPIICCWSSLRFAQKTICLQLTERALYTIFRRFRLFYLLYFCLWYLWWRTAEIVDLKRHWRSFFNVENYRHLNLSNSSAGHILLRREVTNSLIIHVHCEIWASQVASKLLKPGNWTQWLFIIFWVAFSAGSNFSDA